MLERISKTFLLLALAMIGVYSVAAGSPSPLLPFPQPHPRCTNYYTPSIAVVGGYAAALRPLAKPLLVQASCAKPTPTLEV